MTPYFKGVIFFGPSCLRVYNTYRSLTGRSIKKPIPEGFEGEKIFMPIFMPGIKIEHKNFPFLEFYGGSGDRPHIWTVNFISIETGGTPFKNLQFFIKISD